MKKIISLTKTLYKINKNDSSKLSKQKQILLYTFLFAYLFFIFYNFWKLFFIPLEEIGEVSKSIELLIYLGSIFIFATGITSIANILFFSEDTKNILSLPLKNIEVFTAKLITSYLYSLTIDLMFLFPGIFAYGNITNSPLIFYLYAMIIVLAIPIIPIVLIAFIYSIIMPFMKFIKYKNFFKIITTIVILVGILGFQLKLNANMTESGNYNGEYILNLVNNLSSKFFYIRPAISALNNSENFYGIISLLFFLIINFVCCAILIFSCNNLYMNGILANMNGEERILHQSKRKKYKKKFQLFSLIEKDFKNLYRNVTFFIQCLFPSFLMPIVVIAISLTNSNNNISELLPENMGETKIIFGIVIIQFFMLMNYISVTAISRDGKFEGPYMKALPISPRKKIIAKITPGIIIGILQLLISIYFIYKIISLNLYEIIILLICGTLLNFIQSSINVIIDLKHPKIYWESEMAVVKNNINLLYSGLVGLLSIIITAVFSIISAFFSFSLSYILFLIFVFSIILFYIYRRADNLFSKIV